MRDKLRLTPWGKFNSVSWLLIVAVALFIHYGPAAETRFLPVTTKFEIVSFSPHEAGTVVQFDFDKRRQCTLESLTWYKQVDGFRLAFTPMKMNGSPFVDQWTGRIRSARFLLPMTEEEIRTISFATTRHHCHPLWDSVTVVYP